MRETTPYFQEIRERVTSHGGFFNSHLHLDRAGTYHATVDLLSRAGKADGTALPLAGKHAVIPAIHNSECYDIEGLFQRVEPYLLEMAEVGTSRADTVVDTTMDRVGMTALETFSRLKDKHKDRIDLRIGAYSPLGYRDDEPERWALFEKGAQFADFLGLLPERDDRARYPDHIGYEESCRRALRLAAQLEKQIHIHVDQENHENEGGAELIVKIVRDLELGSDHQEEPCIWLIHVISPSAYSEDRFARLAADLAELNIGVICCPAAALSMRQFRPLRAPTHNSIARVLELTAAGVFVRIGSDNICDITSPMGTVNLMDEVRALGDAVRYYDTDFLARIAAGKRLDAKGMERLTAHLEMDRQYVSDLVESVMPTGA